MATIFLPTDDGREQVEGTSFVIVGANGAGKSRLGAFLEMQGSGKLTGRRVSAERRLTFSEHIPPQTAEISERMGLYSSAYENAAQERLQTRWHGLPTAHAPDDFDHVLANLFANNALRDAKFVNDYRTDPNDTKLTVPESDLETLNRVWNSVIPHRELVFSDNKITVQVPNPGKLPYLGREMSDGERVAIYLIAQTLFAPENALLIIDEPEIHLHKAIRDTLWNALQEARRDCTFVFITHDLDFAASQTTATKIWVRDYSIVGTDPRWSWITVEPTNELPEELRLQVLGSRQPTIFVEGESVRSLDCQLYQILYPKHKVMHVGGCKNVIKYTEAMRDKPSLHHLKPLGIIDRDRRSNAEVAALREKGVACCELAEVENLLLCTEVLHAVAKHLDVKDSAAICDQIIAEISDELSKKRDAHLAHRAGSEIANQLGNFSCTATDAQKAKQLAVEHAQSITVDLIYQSVGKELDQAIASKDHNQVLRVLNDKGLTKIAAEKMGIKYERYQAVALLVIKNHPALQDRLRSLVPLPEGS